MSEDLLYEELGLDGQEDIYEDLPDHGYDDTPISPPPLPTTPIPSLPSPAHKSSQAAPPPLPTRAAATTLSSSQTLPPNTSPKLGRQMKAATMKSGKAGKVPPPTKSKGSSSGGGGGIDMSEIMKRARQRKGSSSAIMDLETKIGEKKDENAHVAPWANQLRKPKVPPPTKGEGGEERNNASPPWVKRKSPQEEADEEPEFIRKRKEIQALQEDSDSSPSPPPVRRTPPIPSKPPVAIPNGDQVGLKRTPSPSQGPEESKPAWVRQRERQQQLARGVPSDSKPAVVPKPATKPAPIGPKPPKPAPLAHAPSAEPPPPSPRKPRPTPTPRNVSSQDLSIEPPSNHKGDDDQPTSASVMAKAKMFGDAGKPAVAPKKPAPLKNIQPPREPLPGISPRVEKKSPTPPPVPTRDSSMSRPQVPPHGPSPIHEETAPPPPASRPPPLTVPPPPPDMPPPPTSPPPSSSQPPFPPPPTSPPPPSFQPPFPPPPTAPPPPSSQPPFPPPPKAPPEHIISKPPPSLPSSRPPPSLPKGPISQAQPTPPLGTVLKFRRRPLQSVDLLNPPLLPQRNTKPAKFPAPPPPATEEGDEPEEIYEDTLVAPDQYSHDEGPDDLYDDVSQLRPPDGMSTSQSFSSGPPTPSRPPLPSGPPPLSGPPLPSGPPPTIRPPPFPTDSPEMNYEMDPSLQQNGVANQDGPQELYEDLHPDDSLLSPPPSSLLPPSPSQSSLTPSLSPSLDRKQKLSKDQKKLQKEDEKRKKEMKKREEAKSKNRQKGLKAFKEFKLPNDVKPLFAIEILEEHAKTKDHMAVDKGEACFVLLINHPKLPDDRYFVEKEDGTMGFVNKTICQRTAYQSIPSVSEFPVAPEIDDYEDKDIYEQLPQGEEEEDALHGISGPPTLPPLNFPNQRFPAPSQPPPPPPPGDEPQDNYEYLPEPEEHGSY